MNTEKKIATLKIVTHADGNIYKFYCDLSGALICTTKPYKADTPENELQLAWEQEGKQHFNSCHKCGKQVSNAMFNVDVLECVECAPFESEAKFCKNCGTKIEDPTRHCPACGKPLMYYGKEI
ncbi:MAG: zinc ribbon domain-containing protein [Clostridia bacterium]|nr:zinc ribbon domain-containing protein [Clostridia bacterium]